MSQFRAMRPWEYLEQAAFWIKNAMVDMDSAGKPCKHCVDNARDALRFAMGEAEPVVMDPWCNVHYKRDKCGYARMNREAAEVGANR